MTQGPVHLTQNQMGTGDGNQVARGLCQGALPEVLTHHRVVVAGKEKRGEVNASVPTAWPLPVDHATDLIVVSQDVRLLKIPMDEIIGTMRLLPIHGHTPLTFGEKVCGAMCMVLQGGMQARALTSAKHGLGGLGNCQASLERVACEQRGEMSMAEVAYGSAGQGFLDRLGTSPSGERAAPGNRVCAADLSSPGSAISVRAVVPAGREGRTHPVPHRERQACNRVKVVAGTALIC